MASPKHAIGGLVRGGAAPFRNYFNSHFEMTKDEVRRAVEVEPGVVGSAEGGYHGGEGGAGFAFY